MSRKSCAPSVPSPLGCFVGVMEGVDSIDVDNGKIEISFDASKITKDTLAGISKDSVESSAISCPMKNNLFVP